MLATRFIRAKASLEPLRRPALAVSGLALLSVGLLWLRMPSSDPVPWAWLQDTMSAVFPNPLSVLRGSILIVLGMYVYAPAIQGGAAGSAVVRWPIHTMASSLSPTTAGRSGRGTGPLHLHPGIGVGDLPDSWLAVSSWQH